MEPMIMLAMTLTMTASQLIEPKSIPASCLRGPADPVLLKTTQNMRSSFALASAKKQPACSQPVVLTYLGATVDLRSLGLVTIPIAITLAVATLTMPVTIIT